MPHETIRNRDDYRRFLAMDLRAHGIERWRAHHVITMPELRYQRMLRKVEYRATLSGAGRLLWAVSRVRLARYSLKTGISIPPGVFGPGLSIAHYGSIVVNDQARVGAWCRIQSATNIGTYDGGVPTVGDFAYIAPGAVLYGGITLGDRVTVAANSVARQDAADDSTIVGSEVTAKSSTRKVMPDWIAAELEPEPALV